MTPEQYVKQFYPNAFCGYYIKKRKYAVAIEQDEEQIIIGESEFFESIAWKNAKDWVRSQCKKQKHNTV